MRHRIAANAIGFNGPDAAIRQFGASARRYALYDGRRPLGVIVDVEDQFLAFAWDLEHRFVGAFLGVSTNAKADIAGRKAYLIASDALTARDHHDRTVGVGTVTDRQKADARAVESGWKATMPWEVRKHVPPPLDPRTREHRPFGEKLPYPKVKPRRRTRVGIMSKEAAVGFVATTAIIKVR